MGKFQFKPREKEKVAGYFNLYQARSGAIILAMGNNFSPLTKEQVNDLSIDVYSLEDFSLDDFKKYYQTK